MEAAVLLLAAPALGLSAGVSTSDALTPKADITVLACDQCGLKFGNGKVAAPNCCSVGGSWHGFCDGESHLYHGEQRTHTWHEGFVACSNEEAEELFMAAATSARASGSPWRRSRRRGAIVLRLRWSCF